MTRTYGYSVSMVLMECRSDVSAAAVEPVGLKANWSENDKSGVEEFIVKPGSCTF